MHRLLEMEARMSRIESTYDSSEALHSKSDEVYNEIKQNIATKELVDRDANIQQVLDTVEAQPKLTECVSPFVAAMEARKVEQLKNPLRLGDTGHSRNVVPRGGWRSDVAKNFTFDISVQANQLQAESQPTQPTPAPTPAMLSIDASTLHEISQNIQPATTTGGEVGGHAPEGGWRSVAAKTFSGWFNPSPNPPVPSSKAAPPRKQYNSTINIPRIDPRTQIGGVMTAMVQPGKDHQLEMCLYNPDDESNQHLRVPTTTRDLAAYLQGKVNDAKRYVREERPVMRRVVPRGAKADSSRYIEQAMYSTAYKVLPSYHTWFRLDD